MSEETKEQQPKKSKKWLWVALGVIVVIAIAGSGGSKNTKSESSEPTKTETKQEEVKKITVDELYEKINKGMTEQQVEASAGKGQNCLENENSFTGKIKTCNYYPNGFSGFVSVTFMNGTVDSKTKFNN
jgi:hypothetical protein